jgi:hypothetical protein
MFAYVQMLLWAMFAFVQKLDWAMFAYIQMLEKKQGHVCIHTNA